MILKYDYKSNVFPSYHDYEISENLVINAEEVSLIKPVLSKEESFFEVIGLNKNTRELRILGHDEDLIRLLDKVYFDAFSLIDVEDPENLTEIKIEIPPQLNDLFNRFSFNGTSPKLYYCGISSYGGPNYIRLDLGSESYLIKVSSTTKLDSEIIDKIKHNILKRYNLEKYIEKIRSSNPNILAENLVDLFSERKEEKFRIPKNVFLFLRFRMLESVVQKYSNNSNVSKLYLDSDVISADFMPESLPRIRLVKPYRNIYVVQTSLDVENVIYNYENEIIIENLDEIVLDTFNNVEVIDEEIDRVVCYGLFT